MLLGTRLPIRAFVRWSICNALKAIDRDRDLLQGLFVRWFVDLSAFLKRPYTVYAAEKITRNRPTDGQSDI